MKTWFTEEKIDETTIAISEYGHYEEIHSYLLIGSNCSLLIDSGLGIGDIRPIIEKYIDGKKIMVVATHIHWDHIGGHRYFKDVYVNQNEKTWLSGSFPLPLSFVKKHFMDNCFKNGKPLWFDVNSYTIYKTDHFTEIDDGHIFNLGNRKISCINTPGHSPGHMCFFDNEKGYLFTGDNIYHGTIYLNYPSTDPEAYKKSIDTLYQHKSKIYKLLPAHHDLNISVCLLGELKSILSGLKKENRLMHGTGKIEGNKIAILL